ncbi:DNA-3-methyladenine glycosylase [Leptotrichia hongkongensis]|uniref:DNA-3-methyladenine glycosylase n=1 Tax=Leptotrichia hongkongensis TaxID=554406 RepID=UPI0035A8FA35
MKKINSIHNMKQFFEQDTISLAKNLLGKLMLVKKDDEILGGYIVETEAYLGVVDRACHGFEGKLTPKVEALFGKAGTVYIYTMHTHKMLNIVSCEKGNPQAVLIRGIEPVINVERMIENRGKEGILISNGPGKLTKAMGIGDVFNNSKICEITKKFHKVSKKSIYDIENMEENILYIDFENSKIAKNIGISARIGIPNKGIWTEKELRYFVAGNKYVSRMKKSEFKDECWK